MARITDAIHVYDFDYDVNCSSYLFNNTVHISVQ